MPIYKDDIKLFASKNMTDEEDGGGEMTGVEIVSGVHNSMFPDVSDLDRAYGVVNIRSVHLAVKSALAETYFGATVGVLKQPDDPNVSITLMSQNSPYALRAESRNIIESYLARGVKWQGELFYDQLKGQRAIRIIQRVSKAPVAGEVLVVTDKDTAQEQYVKVIEVTSETQIFSYPNVPDFSRNVITCEISEPLRFTLTGVEPSPYDPVSTHSSIHETMVADAAKYYSVQPLRDNAAFAASEVTVPSVYNQLVPSARIDSAHVNKPIVEMIDVTIPSSADGLHTIAAPTSLESQLLTITKENQGYVYTQTLVPTPALGTVIVSYMVQGKWYELRDSGDGVLVGIDDSYGTGQVDLFGNVNLTLGALPDIESPILFQWGNTSITTRLITEISANASFKVTLPSAPEADTVTINWGDKSASVTDNIISGDATGKVRGRLVELIPNELVAPGTAYDFAWIKTGYHKQYTVYPDKSASLNFILSGQASFDEIAPNSLVFNLYVSVADYLVTEGRENYQDEIIKVQITDDGAGALMHNGEMVGTVNYLLRECVLNEGFSIKANAVEWEQARLTRFGTESWKRKSITAVDTPCSFANHSVTVSINTDYTLIDGSASVTGSYSATPGSITVGVETGGLSVMADSLSFILAGQTYTSIGYNLYVDGAAAGEIDPQSGECLLSSWAAGDKSVSLISGLLKTSLPARSNDLAFITVGSPVAPLSLQVNAVSAIGGNINCTVDADGNITGNGFSGSINYQLGVVELVNTTPLDSDSIKYNCVSYNYLPLDADQLGLDAIRLPSDGRVVIYRKGDVCVIHQDETLTQTVAVDEVVNLPHVRLSELSVTGAEYSADLDAGTVTFSSAGDAVISYRFEDMFLVTDVDISGRLKTSRPLTHAYDAGKAMVASVLIAGDLFARYTNLFDQSTWTGVFTDELIGDEPSAEYNDTIYPLVMTNDGAITERMAIVFTSSTNFKLIGEHIGQIAVGDINSDFAPLNPVSGKPYFTLNKMGWGTGWATGNVLRFNSIGAVYQLNVIRTILQGESANPIDTDTFALQLRGNINKE